MKRIRPGKKGRVREYEEKWRRKKIQYVVRVERKGISVEMKRRGQEE